MQPHYTAVAKNYHSSPFHANGGALEKWQFGNIASILNLPIDTSEIVLDLGAGSCRFARLLLNKYSSLNIVCVDNSAAMLAQDIGHKKIKKICADALEFVQNYGSGTFDHIILKEMIHHINLNQIGTFFQEINRLLLKNGKILICTRPQTGIEYPIGSKAIENWKLNQPDYHTYLSLLNTTGFNDVKVIEKATKVEIKMSDWIGFVRARLWSNFSEQYFSDHQLEEVITEICSIYEADEFNQLHFFEKQIYISAVR